jgi:hypothetical protein
VIPLAFVGKFQFSLNQTPWPNNTCSAYMKNQSPSFVESLGFFAATTVMAFVLFFCVFALAVPVFLLGSG